MLISNFKITHNVRLIIGNPSSAVKFYYATYLDTK